jgi:2-aminoadipate transaminase
MRLNFAGLPEEEIREGIRRIGKNMGADSGLLSTLMGTPPAPQAGEKKTPAPKAPAPPGLADVVELPRRRAKGR